jgi:hypothetical protein
MPAVTEPTNYTKLSKKIIHRADDLAILSPYNSVVREITTDFKPTPVQCVASNPLGPNNLVASRSKCTLFGQLNIRHAFNMTRGPTTVGP